LTEKFIQYIQFEKRFSTHTIKAYKTDLAQFYSYVNSLYQVFDTKEINHHIIRSWIVSLIENSINSRSVNRKLSTLKSYFKFLLKEGLIEQNPMHRIIPPKSSKRLPVFIESESMDLLLDEIDFGEGITALRDKLIIELFYITGIRLNELINIKISDINFAANTIKIFGKRNKERYVPLNIEIGIRMQEYLTLLKTEYPESIYLFLTNNGKKLYEKFVYRLVNSYLSKVTTTNKKSPHILRHTFATHMLNSGADLNAIKEILGHANLSATQVYTHNTIEKLKSVYNQAHPKA
jgi:integrase/recombinase XerC